jgi:uncharacterized protein
LPSVVQAPCDAGPPVALFDARDALHKAGDAALDSIGGRFVTSWPVLTEALYFLPDSNDRRLLWDFVLSDAVGVEDITHPEMERMQVLMARYAGLPMDFADASLVVLAERLHVFEIFTLDRRGFGVFRPRNSAAFQIFP